jgi:hypothetical protein
MCLTITWSTPTATLYGTATAAVLVLEYFLAYSKINRFNIISSIHNSKSGKSKLNMEYQGFLQGWAGHHNGGGGGWTPVGGMRTRLHPLVDPPLP